MLDVDPKVGSAAVIAIAGSGAIALGAVVGATLVWAMLHRPPTRDHDADRRALQMRAAELATRALESGSPLACLDGLAGDAVETACEKALFASPATVATATSYAAARLALVADMAAYVKAGGTDIDATLLPLRRSLEADRFGFLAHALAVRDGCTSENCKALDVLHDANQVRINLSSGTLDRYLDHYLTAWAQPPDATTADAGATTATAQTGTPPPRKMVNIDFPTADSIPAISIMNPEPTGKGAPGAAAAAAADPNPPAAAATPARKPRKQAANPPPQAPQAAAPSVPPAPAQAQVDPVWTPAPPASPQAAAAAPPAANFAPSGMAPVQLTPFTSQQ
jgi:hypothetical protein